MLQGLASLVGPIMCSSVVDSTGTYTLLFFILGAVLVAGGGIFVIYPLAVKFELRKARMKLDSVENVL